MSSTPDCTAQLGTQNGVRICIFAKINNETRAPSNMYYWLDFHATELLSYYQTPELSLNYGCVGFRDPWRSISYAERMHGQSRGQ